jgi:hypothetical protein
MPTTTHLFLSTQRTQTNEQHRQASDNTALNEDRIGIQHSNSDRVRDHSTFLLYWVANEIEIPDPARPSRGGITNLEDDELKVEVEVVFICSGGSGSCSNGRPTSWFSSRRSTPARNP